MTDQDSVVKLRGMAAVGKAIKFVFGNLGHLYATSIIPIGIVILFATFFQFLMIDKSVDMAMDMAVAMQDMDFGSIIASSFSLYTSPTYLLLWLVSMVVSFVFVGMFAIRWHRSALFGDDAPNTGFGFEFSPSLGQYVIRVVLITLISTAIAIGPAAIALVVSGGLADPALALGTPLVLTLAAVGSIVSLYVTLKLNLALPAAALEIPDFGLGEAWNATKGKTFGIFLAFLVMVLVTVGILIVLSIVIGLASFLLPQPDTMLLANPDTVPDFMRSTVTNQLLLTIPTNLILMPVMYGLFTSLLSYIYLQIGKPPAWVSEQSKA